MVPTGPARPNTRPEPQRASTASRQQASVKLRQQLQTRLSEHFEYPFIARRRGYQGTVTLSFRIQANGTLDNIRIAKSSGYGILDRSALKALRQVRRLDNMQQWLEGGGLEMQIPVHYRLQG